MRLPNDADVIGYASAALLVLTISLEAVRQSRPGASEDVAPFVFVGQLLAAVGFTAHSVLVHDTLFTIVSAAMCLASMCGLGLAIAQRNAWGVTQRRPEPSGQMRLDRGRRARLRKAQAPAPSSDLSRAL